jgi:hypothetical protein
MAMRRPIAAWPFDHHDPMILNKMRNNCAESDFGDYLGA